MKKYELLAPVGNFAMLVSAVNAGADAVYFGLQKYGMRANAQNFQIKDLEKIRKICSTDSKNVKMYLTLNTIIYDEELKNLETTIKLIKDKVDAIICSDFAVIELCKKYKIPFFVSTQNSVTNVETAKVYKKLGAKRIVVARELNLKQIKKISKIIEIEAFVHGAMCVSVSGRCFTSQFLFNRSANRGECIHPCRRSFIVKDKQEGFELELENDKVMSAKDLCMLPYVQEMKNSGITSFKIEGRARDARYVDTVVRIYRKALDKKLTKQEIKESMQELENVYNRKFSTGFYLGKPTPKDCSDVEHSASKKKKIYAGKILHYFTNAKVGTLKIEANSIKIGDEICIIGNTTGITKMKVESMQIKNKSVIKSKKGDEIAIKVPERVRKNDEVYIIK
jgi:putative protease